MKHTAESSQTFQVIDKHTGAVVGTFHSRSRARGKADRLDAAYGAYRYIVANVTTLPVTVEKE